jgi:hypothetical protein
MQKIRSLFLLSVVGLSERWGAVMKKLILSVLVGIAVLFTACPQNVGQNDFLGTWVLEAGSSFMQYDITNATLTANYKQGRTVDRRTVYEIFSWEPVTNDDPSTKADFPRGFLIGVRAGLANDTLRIYLNRDKASMLTVGQSQEIYTRPVPIAEAQQNDFYGTWVYEKDVDLGKSLGIAKNRYSINITDNSMTYEDTIISQGFPPETRDSGKMELLAWERVNNEDTITGRDYQTGFAVMVGYEGNEQTFHLFIHRNQDRMIVPEIFDDVVYFKQTE